MENNSSIARVTKAPTVPITNLASLQHHLPLFASTKEDGIRCITHPDYGPASQKLLPIPNNWLREYLTSECPHYLDGELVTLTNGVMDSFNDIQSKIMSRDGEPNFRFLVFDCFKNVYQSFENRYERACDLIANAFPRHTEAIKYPVASLQQTLCRTIAEIEAFEEQALAAGKEGIMLRVPGGYYKEGRSTLREGFLLKVKRFVDDEALVIGVEEQQENTNTLTRDAGGLAKRSKHQAGMRGKGQVGKLVCEWRGHTIHIDGFTEAQRLAWWHRPEKIIGQTVTFAYQQHGMKDLPRCPKFRGIRFDA